MRRVFLDVGAHFGETIPAAVDPRYGFHRIVCFEPASLCWKKLSVFHDTRLEVLRFGLWSRNCRKTLFSAGDLGASIFEEKSASTETEREEIELVRATDWFQQNIYAEDVVVLKLNCEGAECDILEDLMDSGEIKKVHGIYVEFDIRKIPSLKQIEPAVRLRLQNAGVRYVTRDGLAGVTHFARIQEWLNTLDLASKKRLGITATIKTLAGSFRYVRIPVALRWLSKRLRLRRLAKLLGVEKNFNGIKSSLLAYRYRGKSK